MRVWLTLFRRELRAFAYAPSTWLIAVVFLALMGLGMHEVVSAVNGGDAFESLTALLFGENLFFWLALFILVPVLTMRSLAEEARTGTLETLLTAPVTDGAVVSAKFMAAWIVYQLIWLPVIGYPIVLARISPDLLSLDVGALLATWVGIVMLGGCFCAVGLLCSSLTRNPAAAAMLCFGLITVWFLIGFAPQRVAGAWLQEVARGASVVLHMTEFSRGLIDTQSMALYVSVTVWLLFAAVQVLQSRKWRA